MSHRGSEELLVAFIHFQIFFRGFQDPSHHEYFSPPNKLCNISHIHFNYLHGHH